MQSIGARLTASEDKPAKSMSRAKPRRFKVVLGTAVALGIICVAIAVIAFRFFMIDPDRLWSEADAAVRTGRVDTAEADLRWILRARNAEPQDFMLAANIAMARGRDDDAISALRKIPDNSSLASQASYMIGRIELDHHRPRLAETAYRKAVELSPQMVPAHKALIYIYGMQLRRRELDSEYKALAKLVPLTHHDLFTRCLWHFNHFGVDSAEPLETFIKADPEDRHSRLALAEMLVGQPGGETKVEEILAPLGPTDLDSTAILIERTLNRGDMDKATAMLDQTPGRNPRLARLRGRASLMKGDATAAVNRFQDALQDEPYDRAVLADLAKALTIKGDRQTAEEIVARVRKLDDVYNLINRISRTNRENAESDLAALGQACEAAGLTDEATGWYLLAIAHDPLDGESQRALQRLRLRSRK